MIFIERVALRASCLLVQGVVRDGIILERMMSLVEVVSLLSTVPEETDASSRTDCDAHRGTCADRDGLRRCIVSEQAAYSVIRCRGIEVRFLGLGAVAGGSIATATETTRVRRHAHLVRQNAARNRITCGIQTRIGGCGGTVYGFVLASIDGITSEVGVASAFAGACDVCVSARGASRGAAVIIRAHIVIIT